MKSILRGSADATVVVSASLRPFCPSLIPRDGSKLLQTSLAVRWLCTLLASVIGFASMPRANANPVQTVDLSGPWTFKPTSPNGNETTIQVPGGGWYKQGFTNVMEADYTKSITIPDIGQPQVTKIEFGAVNYQADLYVNTTLVGTSIQSWTPATFDITNYVTPGSSYTVRVHVKGRNAFMVGKKSLVPNAGGWSTNTPQGIFSSANLLVYPQVHIADAFVKTSVTDATLTYDVWVRNASATATSVTLSGNLASWNGDAVSYPTISTQNVPLPANSTTKVTIGPVSWNLGTTSYWWPNVPYVSGYAARLHNLNLSISGGGTDQSTVRFGFRELKQQPDGLGNTCYFLNGVRVNFRGDNIQGADYDSITYGGGKGDAYGTYPGFLPGTSGWPKAVANYQRLNFNFVRIHQEPCTPYMLDVCDEKGLMIMEETAIRGSADDQDFVAGHDNMVNHLKALFTRDRNHPSIVRQSLSNEPNQSKTDSTAFEVDLYHAAMAVDGTRPLSIDVGTSNPMTTYDSMNYSNFSAYRHYGTGTQFGRYVENVFARPDRPYGEGEFIWPADKTAKGFTLFATTTQAMRAQGASDIRPYTLLSAWGSLVPGVKRTEMTLEQGGNPLYGEDNLADPWANSQFQRVQAGFNPVLVADTDYWSLNKLSDAAGSWPANVPVITSGQSMSRTLTLYNDTFSGTAVEVFWELRQGSVTGSLSESGNFTASVPLGRTVTQNISFVTPNVADGTLLYLVLFSKKGGVELFRENSQKFVVGQPILANGTYKIVNRNSGKALRAATGLGGNVDQFTSGDQSDQKWTLQNIGGNQYYIINVSNPRYLEVHGVDTADGANVEVGDSTGKNNQVWTIQATSGGYFTAMAVHSGNLLDVYQASAADGANVVQWGANGGPNQQWSFQLQ